MKYFCVVITAALLVGCSVNNSKFQPLAESLNSLCPIILLDGEAELTKATCPAAKFQIDITLHKESPVSVSSLRALDDEYSRLVQEMGEYGIDGKTGGQAFLKGLIAQSPILAQMIDTIAVAASTPESTQGWVPLDIRICDETDTLVYTYNNEWEYLTEHEWLDAIMPIEMCGCTSEGSKLPPLNEVVKVTGIPHVNKEGVLKIYCSYDADPAYTLSGNPMYISEVREKYFNKRILEDYLTALKKENKSIQRYMDACGRCGIGVKFVVEGRKDGIDYDLADSEFIKRWERWGGNDSIIISAPL